MGQSGIDSLPSSQRILSPSDGGEGFHDEPVTSLPYTPRRYSKLTDEGVKAITGMGCKWRGKLLRMPDWEPLIEHALEQREAAYAPYSGFKVGAALQTRDGRVFTGCNVENRTYGLTICAERTAIVKAIAAGATELTALVVATGSTPPAAPCGQCRDTLAEFVSELPILLVNEAGDRDLHDLAELLPVPFKLDP